MAKEISRWLKWTYFIDFIVYMVILALDNPNQINKE